MLNLIALSQPYRQKKKAFFPLMGLFFLLLPQHGFSVEPMAENARKQIYVAVQLQASELVRKEARQRHWPDYSAKMNLFIPAEASQLPLCGSSLSVSAPKGERMDLWRQRFIVRCNEGFSWSIAVTAKPDVLLPVVVARHTLERGQVISAGDLSVRKVNIGSTRGSYVLQPDEVTGLTVRRRIREQQPVAMTQLDSPVLVSRGQQVTMIAEQNGVQAQTVGEAMKKGRKGEVIKVRNTHSERVVSAVVTDIGVVRTVNPAG